MIPTVVTQTNAGSTQLIPFDIYSKPGTASLAIKVVSGSPTCKVEHTFDDIWATGFSAGSATYYDHDTLVSITANTDGNYMVLPRACRLTVTGTGVAQLTVIQMG